MVVHVTWRRLPELLRSLTRWRPKCNPLYYVIQNSLQTHNTWPCIDVYTDTHHLEYCKTVVCKAHFFCKPPYNTAYFAHSIDSDSLTSVLEKEGVLDTKNSYIQFMFVPSNTTEKIRENSQLADFEPICENKHVTYLYDHPSEYGKQILQRSLPEGFIIAKLSTQHDEFLEEHIPYLPYTPTFAKTIEHYNTLAVYNEDHIPISWAIHKEYGEIGYAFTDPAFRGYGLSAFLLMKLSLEVSKFQDPFTYVHIDNDPAHKIMIKCGLRKLENYLSTVMVLKRRGVQKDILR